MKLLADTFPATAWVTPSQTDPPFQITIARVALSNERIVVVKDSQEGPVVVFTESIDPTEYVKDGPNHSITTLSGKEVRWIKESACGCGSRLRTWRPYSLLQQTQPEDNQNDNPA